MQASTIVHVRQCTGALTLMIKLGVYLCMYTAVNGFDTTQFLLALTFLCYNGAYGTWAHTSAYGSHPWQCMRTHKLYFFAPAHGNVYTYAYTVRAQLGMRACALLFAPTAPCMCTMH